VVPAAYLHDDCVLGAHIIGSRDTLGRRETMEDDTLPAADGDALLYDYMKHLTSICLLALGGVLALAEKVQGKSARSVVVAASVIALAAFCSFIASGMIVETRRSGRPSKGNINVYRHASPVLLSVGLGMFLYLFAKSRGG
jgi:hypothetical protein